MAKDINKRIAAEVSWARTHDRAARTRPARETFLKRFEKQVDPDGTLPPEERRQRAEHATPTCSNSRNDRPPHAGLGSRWGTLGTVQIQVFLALIAEPGVQRERCREWTRHLRT